MPSTPTLAALSSPVWPSPARARTPPPPAAPGLDEPESPRLPRDSCCGAPDGHCHYDCGAAEGALSFPSASSMLEPADGQWSAVSCADSGASMRTALADPGRPRQRSGPPCTATAVVTPWFLGGIAREDVTLRDEVALLHQLLSLSPAEREQRKAIRGTVQEVVQQHWEQATVKVYGSFSYDCSLQDSALDLVVEGCGDRAGFSEVVAALQERGLQVECQFEGVMQGVAQGFVKLRSDSRVAANVSFVSGRSPVRRGVALIRKTVTAFPAVPAVFAILRLVLQQVRCGDVSTGGLPAYAVLLMVLHAAHCSSDPSDPGQLLVDFFTLFSSPGPAKVMATSASSAPSPDGDFTVEDPVGGGNAAAGCKRLAQIFSVFKHCGQVLAKWSATRSSGYRGRTPLSSILAYDALWERAHSKWDGLQVRP
eukprot:TRINITY_DN19223_c0_g1_i1.p2 TRINITY_DN19223_c0_g1~~TRINITY_DN19223_c0_g1_i1.p2  ORF type:complete len:447 (+),score=149.56 TRINITY_DN19223_c0_g1_i1:71-1342(+)